MECLLRRPAHKALRLLAKAAPSVQDAQPFLRQGSDICRSFLHHGRINLPRNIFPAIPLQAPTQLGQAFVEHPGIALAKQRAQLGGVSSETAMEFSFMK
jgi:hypothetical protein